MAAAAAKLTLANGAAAEAEAVAREAERALTQAREAEAQGRGPLVEADRKAQRLDTEVRTLSKLLEAGYGGKWRPITDAMVVAKGYEAALGAALGDDLEASDDLRAPAHWAEVVVSAGAALPLGATPLLDHVEAPPALRPRLMQIGLVSRAEGARAARASGTGGSVSFRARATSGAGTASPRRPRRRRRRRVGSSSATGSPTCATKR